MAWTLTNGSGVSYRFDKTSSRWLKMLDRTEGSILERQTSGNEQLFDVGSPLGAVKTGICSHSVRIPNKNLQVLRVRSFH
jgi:hypothetical protein